MLRKRPADRKGRVPQVRPILVLSSGTWSPRHRIVDQAMVGYRFLRSHLGIRPLRSAGLFPNMAGPRARVSPGQGGAIGGAGVVSNAVVLSALKETEQALASVPGGARQPTIAGDAQDQLPTPLSTWRTINSSQARSATSTC